MKTTTNKTCPTPSLVSNSTPAVVSGFTLGLDLGDRQHHVCVLDVSGQIVREASLPNTRPALAQLLAEFPHATGLPGRGKTFHLSVAGVVINKRFIT